MGNVQYLIGELPHLSDPSGMPMHPKKISFFPHGTNVGGWLILKHSYQIVYYLNYFDSHKIRRVVFLCCLDDPIHFADKIIDIDNSNIQSWESLKMGWNDLV